MNLAIMKTKAEQALVEAFQSAAGSLPGSSDVQQVRREAAERFEVLGLPHRRIEEWKYTDLRQILKDALPPRINDATELTLTDVIVALGPLGSLDAHKIVFVNGAYRPKLSTPDALDGLEFSQFATQLADGQGDGVGLIRTTGPADDATLALNTAFMSDGAILSIRAGAELTKPVLVVHIRAGAEPHATTVRHVIDVGAGAKATIVEAFVSLPGVTDDGQINTASEVVVHEEAQVTHVKCAIDKGAVTHLSNWMVRIGREADYRGFQQTHGVALARNQIFVTFDGEDAKLDLSGAVLGRGSDHIDTTLTVDHTFPGCESRELFKHILDGNARGVFQGKIMVKQAAQQTDGKQMAQALMLSPDTEFDSKPELEIFADDVACGHGSTVAEIDEDMLFYCASRGIPEAQARALLTEAFIAEVIEMVRDQPVAQALTDFARNWLKAA